MTIKTSNQQETQRVLQALRNKDYATINGIVCQKVAGLIYVAGMEGARTLQEAAAIL